MATLLENSDLDSQNTFKFCCSLSTVRVIWLVAKDPLSPSTRSVMGAHIPAEHDGRTALVSLPTVTPGGTLRVDNIQGSAEEAE